MNVSTPLPPHLEQFVREQLTLGRFQSENEVICAALRLLEEHSPHEGFGERLTAERNHALRGKSREAAPKPVWQHPREWLRANEALGNGPPARTAVVRSPRGLLADLRSDLSPEDIKEARSEMWAGLSHGAAG